MLFLNGSISNEIAFVYGLIAIVVLLIIIILVIDHREKKKEKRKRSIGKNSWQAEINQISVEPKASEVELPMKQEMEIPVLESANPTEVVSLDSIVPVKEKESVVIEEEPVEKTSSISIDRIDDVVESVKIEEEKSGKPVHQEITYVEEDPELERTNAQMELQKLTMELEKAQETESQCIDLTNFELEQEENAIISIDELMKKSDELYDKNEAVQYMDEGNEPINLEELQQKFAKENQATLVVEEPTVENKPVETMNPPKKVVMEEFITPKVTAQLEEKKKFKNSPFISPVYGIEKEKKDPVTPVVPVHADSIELEQTANLEKLDQEIKKTNEFLKVLKELQKNLD